MSDKTHTYKDGSTYEGDWKNGQRHGYGVWERTDGLRYEGEWEYDKPHGQGVLTTTEGQRRSGVWEKGKYVGEKESLESGSSKIEELGKDLAALKHEMASLKSRVEKIETKGTHFQSDSDFEENKTTVKKVKTQQKQPHPKKSKWWLAAIVVVIAIIVVAIALGGDGNGDEITAVDEPVEETEADIGEQEQGQESIDNSRSNPAGVNEVFSVSKKDFLIGDVEFEIEMLELVSGDDAWGIIYEANEFNDEPPEDMEYILAKFRVRILSTEEDDPYDLNHAKFSAVSAEGVEYTEFISVSGLEPNLRADLYEGAEHTGWTYFLVEKNDSSPLAVMDRRLNSEIWFSLR